MSEWDFLWSLEGDELMEAMSTGMTDADYAYLEEQERKERRKAWMDLKKLHLDVPGTAYFDPELEHLSAYYNINPSKRVYFVALDPEGQVVGGVGIAAL